MKFYDERGDCKHAVASYDTLCEHGNWVSLRLRDRLGKRPSMSTNFRGPDMAEASGRGLAAIGVIDLEWREPQGRTVFQNQFYVFSTTPEIDVIFGASFIMEHKLFNVRKNVFLPLLLNEKLTAGKTVSFN